jgi:hypothetical protein
VVVLLVSGRRRQSTVHCGASLAGFLVAKRLLSMSSFFPVAVKLPRAASQASPREPTESSTPASARRSAPLIERYWLLRTLSLLTIRVVDQPFKVAAALPERHFQGVEGSVVRSEREICQPQRKRPSAAGLWLGHTP